MEDLKFELEQFMEMVEFDKQTFIDKFEEKIEKDTIVKLLNIYIEDLKELIGE